MDDCPQGNYSYTAAYPSLEVVQQSYKNVHPYLCLVICSYGVISNVINIIVLTKPTMRNSINCMLTGIAVADIVTMTSYIPFSYHYYLMDNEARVTSKPWITFLAVHMNLTLISHTSSIWLGVIMAAMRYFFVRPTARGAKTLGLRSTLIFIIVTFFSAGLLIIPNCLATRIEPCHCNRTGLVNWHLKPPTFGDDSDLLHTITFFIYPVAGKIIPCTLISIFGGLLLHTLRETDKRARRLKGVNNNSGAGNAQTRRTTTMLLAIIALYIISEVPQSIMVLLCIFVKDFFLDVYNPLSDFIDLLSLINTAVNFFTYYTMSTQFRKTLKEVTCSCVKSVSCKCCSRNNNNALQNTKYSKTPPVPV